MHLVDMLGCICATVVAVTLLMACGSATASQDERRQIARRADQAEREIREIGRRAEQAMIAEARRRMRRRNGGTKPSGSAFPPRGGAS